MTTPTEIVQTRRFGVDQGEMFNDFTEVGGWLQSITLRIDEKHPIEKILIQSHGVVDGITVTYRLADGSTTEKHHGTTPTSPQTVTLGDHEVIVAVSGKSGDSRYGNHVNQISFSILDTETSQLRVAGPYGGHGTAGTVFHVEGVLLAFAGSSFDGEEPVGLNSLTCYVTPSTR